MGNDYPIGPANQFRATPEEIPQRAYDPDKAKHHLKKAGHDSIDLTLHAAATAFEGAVDACILYAEKARPAGINQNSRAPASQPSSVVGSRPIESPQNPST